MKLARRIIALIALVACSVIPRSTIGQTTDDQIALHFRAGQEALRQAQFARATEEFKKVLSLDPTLLEAEVNLGLAYHSSFEYDLAVRHLARALQQRPNLLAANVIAGIDCLKLGFTEQALHYLQRALKLDSSNREARQALASLYLSQKDFRAAAGEFRQIAALASDESEAWFRLGHEYLDLSARLAYRAAHLYPDSAWGHRFLGDLLFQRGRWDEAAKEYGKALASDSGKTGLHTSLGQAYLHAGQLEKAEGEFQLELQADSSYELAWLGRAESALARGQAGEALEDVGKVWNISPEFLVLQREFPTIELSPPAAKAQISAIQASSTDGPPAHFLLASLYAAANDSAQSEAQWNGVHLDFQAWQNQDGRTVPADTQHDPCKAHRYASCAKLLTTQKTLTDPQKLLLGKTQVALREFELASDTLAQITGESRENAEASYWLALSYRSLGAQCYARLQESFPDSWRTHQLRGEGYALRQELDDALKEFRAALQLRSNEPELHEAIGEVYLDRHADEDARRELEGALELDPSRTRALYLLGRLYIQRRENERALPYLQKAVRLQPDLVEASGLLGTTYVRLGQFTNAIPQLKKAASSDHYGNLHYQLYLAYRKTGQAEQAQKALARSQELRRNSLEHDQALIMGAPQMGGEPE